MRISDGAVEAAAKAAADLGGCPKEWQFYLSDARAMLEAAAPYMLAEAFEAAAAQLETPGQLWWGDSGVSVLEDEATLRRTKLTDWLRSRVNPYRSQP